MSTALAAKPTRASMQAQQENAFTPSQLRLEARAQEAAVCFLKRRGHIILESEWTCPQGSIDIISRDNNTIVFTEVKVRADRFVDTPITPEKRNSLEKIAMDYLKECKLFDMHVRFDMVSVIPLGTNKAFIRHCVDALSVV